MKILVTGGAGYIGSHTLVELLAAGHDPVVIDNFCNSKRLALDRVRAISGRDFGFLEADLRDQLALKRLFNAQCFDAVIHFAGLKAVAESTQKPLEYYNANLGGTLNLCTVMQDSGVKTLVFSSSATVYGEPKKVPIGEDFPLSATNPYGRSKLFIEELLRDLAHADNEWNISLLRYFNPVGAHVSGLIGEDPNGMPNNLMPLMTQVAIGKRPELQVFGGDYPTPDGTGVRDYIHVVDLARGHVQAIEQLAHPPTGIRAYNLGTGRGHSVLEMIQTFTEVTGRTLPYRIVARRPGDIAQCYADPTRAHQQLHWQATLDLTAMVADSWRWQLNNPQGYNKR